MNAAAMLAALALAAHASAPSTGTSSVTVTERVIVRVPLPPPPRGAAPKPTRWRESHAPSCIALAAISGAAITAPASVDFVLRGGARVRARLDSDCPALDYYSGFYLSPTADGRICADRDTVHDRSGGECGIDRFRAIRAVAP